MFYVRKLTKLVRIILLEVAFINRFRLRFKIYSQWKIKKSQLMSLKNWNILRSRLSEFFNLNKFYRFSESNRTDKIENVRKCKWKTSGSLVQWLQQNRPSWKRIRKKFMFNKRKTNWKTKEYLINIDSTVIYLFLNYEKLSKKRRNSHLLLLNFSFFLMFESLWFYWNKDDLNFWKRRRATLNRFYFASFAIMWYIWS